jgi:hypothetical protein
MKGFAGLTKKESDNILKQHSKVYDGYAVGNVPTNMYPISVYDDARDSAGITLTNQNVVKTYRNHRINEITAKPLNYDEIDNAYDFESRGPQQSMVLDVYDESPVYNFKSKGPVDVFEDEPDFEKMLNSSEYNEQDEPDFEKTLGEYGDSFENLIDDEDKLEIERDQIEESIYKTMDMFNRFRKYN